jgi:L-ascorbate metabolism protein UlaG (beta-lactamase superfamily)
VQNVEHMQLRLIRHATLIVDVAAKRVLVDPMLDPAGRRPPAQNTRPERRNPLTELPEPAEVVVSRIDGAIVTHLHSDHFDECAADLLPKDTPLLCQPADEGVLRDRAFTDVRPVGDRLTWDGITVVRTGGRHGTGAIADELAPVSGFVLAAAGEPTLYIAGDTIWCDEVADALDEHHPDVVVVNAGGARYVEGDPITMTAGDVLAVARHAPDATVVAVHMEAINHCLETRADLHQRLREEGLLERVIVPEDGAAIPL